MLKNALTSVLVGKRANPSATQSSVLGGLFSFGTTSTGEISTQQALMLSALYNGVSIISNDIAMLPKAVYKKSGKNKDKDYNHPVYRAISKQANQNQTAFWFYKVMVFSAILRGNAVAIINRNKSTGQLDPDNPFVFVHPNNLRDIKLIDGELWFYTNTGVYHNTEVIHIKGFSSNGYVGESVLKYAANNLNAALMAESFAQTNFESKGFGLGMISSEKTLEDNAKKNLAGAMESRLSAGGKYNIGVLDEGMKFDSISVNAQEVELINWKKISTEDIARWLNINPYKLKQTDKLNYSTIEQQSLDHLSDSIMPWVVQFENEYDLKLFTKAEQSTTYTKFNINALLRVDAKSRAEFYNKMRFSGSVSANEIRQWEDLNPIDLPYMNEPLQPVQLQQQKQIDNSHE